MQKSRGNNRSRLLFKVHDTDDQESKNREEKVLRPKRQPTELIDSNINNNRNNGDNNV